MPELARRDNIELVRTGKWGISSGDWQPKPEDLVAAVAALNCPAIRKAPLKIGHTDQRFTPGDGEPAIGWIENLRTIDGGHTLVGDFVGVPAWLNQVMASAYPDRSVEGMYSFRCQIGHTHPFVLTACALLGVTPPGVGTLRSLNDVRDLFDGQPAQTDGVAVTARVSAAEGDDDRLKKYWTKGEGLKRWVSSAHPWTTLYGLLKKHVGAARAKPMASAFFHPVFGYWPGSRGGKNPAGPG